MKTMYLIVESWIRWYERSASSKASRDDRGRSLQLHPPAFGFLTRATAARQGWLKLYRRARRCGRGSCAAKCIDMAGKRGVPHDKGSLNRTTTKSVPWPAGSAASGECRRVASDAALFEGRSGSWKTPAPGGTPASPARPADRPLMQHQWSLAQPDWHRSLPRRFGACGFDPQQKVALRVRGRSRRFAIAHRLSAT